MDSRRGFFGKLAAGLLSTKLKSEPGSLAEPVKSVDLVEAKPGPGDFPREKVVTISRAVCYSTCGSYFNHSFPSPDSIFKDLDL
jgi:hypothetical protein